jgi:ATP-binding cassette subfamily B protein
MIEILQSGVDGSSTLPQFIVDIVRSFDTQTAMVMSLGVILLIWQVLRYALLLVEGYTRGLVKERVSYKQRNRLYNHIQNLKYSYHNNVDTGDLIQRVTSDIDSVTNFMTDGIGSLVYILFSILSGVFQLLYINYYLVIICLSVVPIYIVFSYISFRKVEKVIKAYEAKESEMTVSIQEALNGNKVVKSFGNEAYEIKKVMEKSGEFRDLVMKEVKYASFFWGFNDFLAYVEYFVVILVCILLSLEGKIDIGGIISSIALVGMLIWPVRELGRLVSNLNKSLVASDRLNEIIVIEDEYKEDGTTTPLIKGDIEFKDVYFKFNDTEKHLLNGLSFSVKKGQTVAIVGKTGSGKSTIINLLLRMYECEKGTILIDGEEISNIKKQHLRKNIGVVFQEPFLYNKSIFDNLAITNTDIDKESVYSAAKIATIDEDIQGFKNKYETTVGEKGTSLSGGQRQRVAIARILVDKRPIIIFDDALSAVDSNTDNMIRNSLNNAKNENKATTIIITHRISTAKQADNIIVIENGQVAVQGTHDELIKVPGLYKTIWDIQGNLENEFVSLLNEQIAQE